VQKMTRLEYISKTVTVIKKDMTDLDLAGLKCPGCYLPGEPKIPDKNCELIKSSNKFNDEDCIKCWRKEL
jgi:hypothetical protein